MALEGAYAFDVIGSSTILDLSGNGRNISLTGQPGAQVDSTGILDDGALGKTGVGTIPLPSALRTAIETDNRTIMVDAAAQRGTWWVRAESTSLDTGVWGMLSLDTVTMLARARTQANGTSTPASPSIGALAAGVRHNYCITYVRSTGVLTYYYDGAQIGTATFTAGTALYTGADNLNIAEWGDIGPAMDNLRFFSHALTAPEVAALAGTPVEAGGSTVTGTATANLGGLTGTVVGRRTVTAVAVATLSGLSASASGVRTASGTAAANLGGLTATVVGRRTVRATALATSGLTATATGQRHVSAVALASLGQLVATAIGSVSGHVSGTALASLGSLVATMVVPNPIPATRIVISGREPTTRLSGREPRESL